MIAHPIPRAALLESIAVVGRTGSGKTFAVKGMVELLLRENARVCVIDPTSAWYGLRSSVDGKKPAFPIVVFGGDHGDVTIADSSGAAVGELLATSNLPAVIDISELSRAGMARFVGAFLEALYRHNKLPLTLVVDEADMFAPQRPEPETANMLGRMEQIVRRGRLRGFRPWLITQRPASLNKNVLSQANTLIAMQLTAPQDRDAIGAWIEGQADRDEGKKVLAELPRLKKGEGFVWSPSHDVLQRVSFPKITTFDSSRSPEEGETLPQLQLAAVDLAGIAESLRTVEKDAAENDPKLLRKRVAELYAETVRLKSAPGEPAADPEALDREYRRGYMDGRAASVDELSGLFGKLAPAMEEASSALHELRNKVGSWALAPHANHPHLKPSNDLSKTHKLPQEVKQSAHRGNGAAGSPSTNIVPTGNTVVSSAGTALPRAERLTLACLAQYPDGRSKVQVAILTGYAVGGGGFSNAISALRTRELLEGDAANLKITPRGIATLGPFEPLPSGRALLAYWCGRLGKAERRARLATLMRRHGFSVDRTFTKVFA